MNYVKKIIIIRNKRTKIQTIPKKILFFFFGILNEQRTPSTKIDANLPVFCFVFSFIFRQFQSKHFPPVSNCFGPLARAGVGNVGIGWEGEGEEEEGGGYRSDMNVKRRR